MTKTCPCRQVPNSRLIEVDPQCPQHGEAAGNRATAGDVAATLAQLVLDMADEHEPLLDNVRQESLTGTEFADASQVVQEPGYVRFRVLLADGRAFTVRVEEELCW